MSLTTVPVSSRNAAYDGRMTAGGGYTIPQYAFLPHPSLSVIGTGSVPAPVAGVVSASFAGPPQLATPQLPEPAVPVYGVRMATIKMSP